MDGDDVSDDIEQVREEIYQRELKDKALTCVELLETLWDQLEDGHFAPTNPEDEVYREHLISTLKHAGFELERWCVDREAITPS